MKKSFVKLFATLVMCCIVGASLIACDMLGFGDESSDSVSGTQITISDDGYWVIDGVKTEHKVTGEAGVAGKDGVDGYTPVIEIIDGYWFIDGVNTGILAQGPQGEKGDQGYAGYTPVIEIINGFWYVNGENTGVSAQGGANGNDYIQCEEHEFAYYMLKEHEYNDYEVTEGEYLKYCLICCGYAEIVRDVIHVFGSNYVEYPATCTEPGYCGILCDICGYVKMDDSFVSSPPIGHNFEYKPTYDSQGYNVCEGGALLVGRCTNVLNNSDGSTYVCGETDYRFESLNGHHIDAWTIVGNNMDGTDMAQGVCADCGKTISIILPAFSPDNENYISENQDGTIWSYRVQAEDVLNGKKLRYEHIIEAVYSFGS